MDRTREMVVFTQVVEARSFSGAARRLGLSKSAVSKQVAQLEDRLGVQLLHRTTRQLSLTEVGRTFYERAVQIVREIEEVELEVARTHAAPQGLLRVNAPMSFGQRWLAPAVAEFLARHPELRAELVLDDRSVDAIEGGFDVSIRIAPALVDSTLIARRLAPNRLVVCGAPDYFTRRGVPHRPADLAGHDCLLYSYQSWGETWRFVGPRGQESVSVSGVLRANNGDALREAALKGLGLLFVPSFLVGADLAQGTLRAVLDRYTDRSTAIWALYSPTRHPSAKVRAFVEFLIERFGPEPEWEDGSGAWATRTPRSSRSHR